MENTEHPEPARNPRRRDLSRWLADEEQFRSEWLKGDHHARLIAERLMESGFTVTVTEATFRKDVEDRHKWAHDVDLWIGRACDGLDHDHRWTTPLPLEAKSRSLVFTSPQDYPYPTAMVDTQSGWLQKADPKPLAVLIMSQKTRAIIVAPEFRSGSWQAVRHFDRVRRIQDTWLEAPVNTLLTFEQFVEGCCRNLRPCQY